jgi:putative hemolysin
MLQQLQRVESRRESANLYYSMARSHSEVAEAQRLRYKVFAEEMGARLTGDDRRDRDGFDAVCDHLLVRDNETGVVVGTYRILDPEMAREARGYYSGTEFDITRLLHLAPRWWKWGGPACIRIIATVPPSPCCGRGWPNT